MFSTATKIPGGKNRGAGWALAILAFSAAGCSTTETRANKSAEFATWPIAVQQTVLAGRIDIGFTAEQVRVALGEPDYRSLRTTADGTTEVWGYRDRKPRFGFGLGVGGYRGSTGIGTGVMVGPGTRPDDEKVRVIFDRAGRVAAVEEAQRR